MSLKKLTLSLMSNALIAALKDARNNGPFSDGYEVCIIETDKGAIEAIAVVVYEPSPFTFGLVREVSNTDGFILTDDSFCKEKVPEFKKALKKGGWEENTRGGYFQSVKRQGRPKQVSKWR